ncbi:hypothetical protein YC2023_075083 [Brassica napus]
MAATTIDISAPEVEFFGLTSTGVWRYLETMKTILGSKFPTVTEHESEQVKGAIDCIGLIITRHFTVKDKSTSLKQDLHVFNIDKACAYTMETATSTVVYHRKLRQPSYIYITYSQTTPQSLSLEDSRKNKYLSSHTEAMLHSLG